MSKEISDRIKGELKILCDNCYCPIDERGERARCYLDIYPNCELYSIKLLKEKERRKKGNN